MMDYNKSQKGSNETESKNKEHDDFYIHPNGAKLSNSKQFGINLGLFLSERMGFYANSLVGGETNFDYQKVANTFKDEWGVNDKATAIQTLEYLVNTGHRQLFNDLLKILVKQGCGDADSIDPRNTIFRDNWEEVVRYLENLDDVYENDEDETEDWFQYGEEDFLAGTDAWDFVRIIFNARAFYSLGYITEEEAWNFINKAVQMAISKYDNYEDYATSFLLGRAMWGGSDNGDWSALTDFASDIINKKRSPCHTVKWGGI